MGYYLPHPNSIVVTDRSIRKRWMGLMPRAILLVVVLVVIEVMKDIKLFWIISRSFLLSHCLLIVRSFMQIMVKLNEISINWFWNWILLKLNQPPLLPMKRKNPKFYVACKVEFATCTKMLFWKGDITCSNMFWNNYTGTITLKLISFWFSWCLQNLLFQALSASTSAKH